MLRPEIIEKLRKQREERDRPALQIPLYPPDGIYSDFDDEDEVTEASGVIVIDLI